MKISKSYQRFFERKLIKNPKTFLGHNRKAIINFWLYLDTLTDYEWNVVESRVLERYKVDKNDLFKTRLDISATLYCLYQPLLGVPCTDAICNATEELLRMHNLLDQQKPLTFFKMFLDL